MQTAAKPVPKTSIQVVNTAWQPGERNVKRLARSELLNILLHHWDEGGEVALHHHTDGDATWVILGGEVTFYGEGDQVLAKAGPREAVLIPRNTMYWFTNSGTSPLEMFRISAKVGGMGEGDDRVYHQRNQVS
jgi:mannose-6-phosphate isomerase-like protein (cupin superfamily)